MSSKELQELIETVERFEKKIDRYIEADKMLNDKLKDVLEHWSWQTLRMRSDLLEIKEYIGV